MPHKTPIKNNGKVIEHGNSMSECSTILSSESSDNKCLHTSNSSYISGKLCAF